MTYCVKCFPQFMKTSQPNLLLAEVLLICSVKLINAWVIKWLFLKPSWNLKSFLFFLEKELTCVGSWLVSPNKITESQNFQRYDYILQYVLTPWKHNSNGIKIVQITYFIQIKSRSCPINSFLLWYSIKGHWRISSSHRFTRVLNR